MTPIACTPPERSYTWRSAWDASYWPFMPPVRVAARWFLGGLGVHARLLRPRPFRSAFMRTEVEQVGVRSQRGMQSFRGGFRHPGTSFLTGGNISPI